MIYILKNGTIIYDEKYLTEDMEIHFSVDRLPSQNADIDGFCQSLKVDMEGKSLSYEYEKYETNDVIEKPIDDTKERISALEIAIANIMGV